MICKSSRMKFHEKMNRVLYVGKTTSLHSADAQPNASARLRPFGFFCVSFAVGSRYVEEAHDRAPAGCAHPDAAE